MQHIAVVNTGSSTLKLALFETDGERLRERSNEAFEWPSSEERDATIDRALGGLQATPDLLGHRVVHGGSKFTEPVRIDDSVEAALEDLVALAPLHNAPALAAIRLARRRFPDSSSVAVFDTAFHAKRPEESMRYALPRQWNEEFGFRRYGFHGIAHESLATSYSQAESLPMSDVSAVTLQLGAGCSACAIKNGRSIETSMGYTPLEGLVMSTRSGDLDPAIVLALLRAGHPADEIEEKLNRRSGLFGLAGTGDMRQLLQAETRGDPDAKLALKLFVHRLVMTIGGYLTFLEGEGAIIFGGGIGENSPEIRDRVAQGLTAWNVALDPALNTRNRPGRISRENGCRVYVFATREEEVIAKALLALAP